MAQLQAIHLKSLQAMLNLKKSFIGIVQLFLIKSKTVVMYKGGIECPPPRQSSAGYNKLIIGITQAFFASLHCD